jgi:hypothetical protein
LAEEIEKANADSKEAMRHALALDIVGEDPQGTSNQVSLSLRINKNTRISIDTFCHSTQHTR